MTETKRPNGALTFAVDFGPLLIFFLAYKFAGPGGVASMVIATIAFMVAIVIAIGVGLLFFRRVSPMTWISAILIIGFGGLTIYLRDPKFIQLKPTIIYLLFAGALLAGLARRKAVLRWLFGPIFPGLNEIGWLKLTRNWALFFLLLAGVNEVMRTTLSFDTWLTIKVWGMTLVSVAFALANVPMLLRHGLDPEAKVDSVEQTPVE